MKPAIFSLGHSLPAHTLSQMEIAGRLIDLLNLDDETAWLYEKIYKNSSIDRRYSVLSDFLRPKTFSSGGKGTVGMSERNAIYKKEAPILAENAARQALAQWKRPAKEITHVISVSCTGVMTPGIEFLLMERLGLDRYTSLLGINFMGCHGAFKGLKAAAKIALENPKNRILLVCTELCTLHFKGNLDMESIVIESLFADGAAAVIVGTEPGNQEEAIFSMEKELSYAVPDSLQDMTWNASDHGFDMTLSRRVPGLISAHLESFAGSLTEIAGGPRACEWAVHPGGKAIIETVENVLGVDRSRTESSWNTLRRAGNLSSATILFVLQDMQQRTSAGKHVACIGFGPGLSVEGVLLRR